MIMKNGTRKWGLQLPQWSKSPLRVEAAMSSKAKPSRNLNPPPTTSYRKRKQAGKEVANENKPYHHHQQYHPHLLLFFLPSLLILTYRLQPHPPLQLAQSKLFYSTASLSLPVSILFSFMSSPFLEFMD